jgi:hypothetical protein
MATPRGFSTAVVTTEQADPSSLQTPIRFFPESLQTADVDVKVEQANDVECDFTELRNVSAVARKRLESQNLCTARCVGNYLHRTSYLIHRYLLSHFLGLSYPFSECKSFGAWLLLIQPSPHIYG